MAELIVGSGGGGSCCEESHKSCCTGCCGCRKGVFTAAGDQRGKKSFSMSKFG